ncbi:hypothetical protein [Sphingomonas sp. 7/4-4]|uniref:hypothetical protein n=1 Tax=Sphingomonas sp. 7/4-4 TaxID=3018446 RepID=UPI00300DCAD0
MRSKQYGWRWARGASAQLQLPFAVGRARPHPYVRDAADLVAFHRWWDAVFGLLARLGVAPASLAELLDAACGAAPSSATAAGAGGL